MLTAIKAEILETGQLLVEFLRHPRVDLPRHGGAWLPVAALLTILGIDIGIDLLINLILGLSEAAGAEAPTAMPMNWSVWHEVLALLIIAPVTEELQFRGWLNGHRRNLVLAGLVVPVLYMGYMLPLDAYHASNVLMLIAAVLLVAGTLWWRRQPAGADTVPRWFAAHFGWIMWGSTLAFGLIHAWNFSNFDWGPDLAYILPQTIGGVMLTFTRLRLGIRAAMVHHVLFNGYTGLYDLPWWAG